MQFFALLVIAVTLIAGEAMGADGRNRFDGSVNGGYSQYSVVSPTTFI
jgi:hypothetical protein